MKQSIFLFTLILAFLFTNISCGKYEDGPSLTLLSKKSRAVNSWHLDLMLNNQGLDVTDNIKSALNFKNLELNLLKDNTYEEITINSLDSTVTITGSWAFSDDKTKLLVINGTLYDTLYILKLESKEMWLRDVESCALDLEYHYIEK